MNPKYDNRIFQYSMLVFGLFIFLIPTELFGSTIYCGMSNSANCENVERLSPSNTAGVNNTNSDNIRTPLLLPDITPKEQELSTPMTNPDPDTSDVSSGNNNDDSNYDDTNRDNAKENDQDSGSDEDT